MNINYDYYKIFYYVAKYRSFTAAANALMNNQPNITRMIKKLENELECTLFYRQRHGVTLTPEGEKLFSHIRIAMEHIEAGEEELLLDKTLQEGTISIATTDIALYCFLLPILKEYRHLYPGIRIRILSHSAPQALTALKNGSVDLAVVTTPIEISSLFKCTRIGKFQDVVVCGSAYAYLKGQKLSMEQLTQYPLICLGEHTKTYEFYCDLFAKQGLTFEPSIEATAADQIPSLVSNNLGIGFIPIEFLKNMSGSEIYRLELNDEIPSRDICLVKRCDFSMNIASRKLEEMVLNHIIED